MSSKHVGGGGSSSPKGGGTANAFALIMKGGGGGGGSSGNKRPRPSSSSISRSSSGRKQRGTGTTRIPNYNSPSNGGSRFIECPACLKHVLMDALNGHLDGGCVSGARRAASAAEKDETKNDDARNNFESHDISEALLPIDRDDNDNEKNRRKGDAEKSIADEPLVDISPPCDDPNTSQHTVNQIADPSLASPQPAASEKSPPQTTKSSATSTSSDAFARMTAMSQDADSACQPTQRSIPTLASPQPATSNISPPQTTSSSATSAPSSGVFAKMMAKSQELFSSKAVVTHHFHLHDANGRLSWTDDGNTTSDAQTTSSNAHLKAEWSESVRIRPISGYGSNGGKRHDMLTDGRDIELIVSSSIGSAALTTGGYGLVKRHSRLSVPVLKSILQKSIRRRRPLPAVRVAMELADKSFGDLIRRMPIMMLEDSILHPDLPLLVWLMVAESKGYKPPLVVMQRIMRIVFEVASCPIKDPLPSTHDEECDAALTNDDGDNIIASSLGHEYETLLRSMLLRVSYGGMKCDTRMVIQYERLWRYRFTMQQQGPNLSLMQTQNAEGPTQSSDGEIVEDKARVAVAGGDQVEVLWSDLPAYVHQKAFSQSMELVPLLVASKIEKLRVSDCCAAGVDFHCSAVLESVLSDNNIYSSLIQHMNGTANIPAEGAGRNEWALGIAKSCMWAFSSGINYKRDLIGRGDNKDVAGSRDAKLKTLWDDTLCVPAKRYMDTYISSRLIT